MNDTSKGWLQAVVNDMCSYTTSTGTKDVEETDADGNVTTVTKSVLYVNVTLKSYRDMISVYGFNSDHVEMLEQIMSPEFMGQLGYAGSGSGGGGGSPGVSSMTEDEINAILNEITDSRQKTVCSYAVAAFTAGSKIEQIFTQAFVAQGTASATYNAQNIGAGKLERVREGFRASHFIGIVYSVVVGGFLFFAGKYFAYLFISDNIGEVLPMVAIYVKCVALFFIPLYFVNVLRNGIQGMGYGLLPMMAGVAELAGRGITATIAAGKSSYIGTCLASPVAWIFATVLLWVMYFYVMKDMARKLYGTNKL